MESSYTLTNGLLSPMAEGITMLLISMVLGFSTYALSQQLNYTSKPEPTKQQLIKPFKYVSINMHTTKGKIRHFKDIKIPKSKLVNLKLPPKIKKLAIQKPVKTIGIVSRITREIIADEVNSFVRRARLVAEITRDLSQ